jgi:N6-adenosine-specific RNA methylase IME4
MLESGKYKVIYIDCPWNFQTHSVKGKGRSAEAHYKCMNLNDIKNLPVRDWADKDCVLLMWVTDPMLEKGLEVIRSWGFNYKTVGFYWVKTNKNGSFFMGTGYWTRANPEQCLLATIGHPKRINRDVRKVTISRRREHSRKPEEMYERIERLCEGPYLEVFSRSSRPGWDSWGDQVGLFDDGPVKTRKWKSNSYPGKIEDISNEPTRDC